MDARATRSAQGLGGYANVVFNGAGKAADSRVLGLGGDGGHGGKVAGTRYREAGLDDIDAQRFELPRND